MAKCKWLVTAEKKTSTVHRARKRRFASRVLPPLEDPLPTGLGLPVSFPHDLPSGVVVRNVAVFLLPAPAWHGVRAAWHGVRAAWHGVRAAWHGMRAAGRPEGSESRVGCGATQSGTNAGWRRQWSPGQGMTGSRYPCSSSGGPHVRTMAVQHGAQ